MFVIVIASMQTIFASQSVICTSVSSLFFLPLAGGWGWGHVILVLVHAMHGMKTCSKKNNRIKKIDRSKNSNQHVMKTCYMLTSGMKTMQPIKVMAIE